MLHALRAVGITLFSLEYQSVSTLLGVELVEVSLGDSALEGNLNFFVSRLAEPLHQLLLVVLVSCKHDLGVSGVILTTANPQLAGSACIFHLGLVAVLDLHRSSHIQDVAFACYLKADGSTELREEAVRVSSAGSPSAGAAVQGRALRRREVLH